MANLPYRGILLISSVNSFSQDKGIIIEEDSTGVKTDSIYAPETFPGKASDSVKAARKATIYYNSDDSVATRFLINRLNLADEATRSFQHDASGFMKLNPSNLVLEEQMTPFRSTALPVVPSRK